MRKLTVLIDCFGGRKRADQIFVIRERGASAKRRGYTSSKLESTELDFKNFKYTELAPQNHVDGTELEIFGGISRSCAMSRRK